MNERYRLTRDLDGILLLNKPANITSNLALQKVKHALGARKAGHTGSLDPIATGMLPICLGEATKFSQFLLEADKAYRVTAKLGVKTTTSDREGDVIATAPVPEFSSETIETALNVFRGPILQVPSMYSALKHEGQPLYRFARKGIEIERPARPVTIYEFTLLERRGDEWDLDVRCSKGTYIRNLVEDLGEHLGCHAHVTALHRRFVSPFDESSMQNLETIGPDSPLLSLELALHALPTLNLESQQAERLTNGQAIAADPSDYEGIVTLYNDQGQFLGIGNLQKQGHLTPKRLLKRVATSPRIPAA